MPCAGNVGDHTALAALSLPSGCLLKAPEEMIGHSDPVTRASQTGAATEKWPVEKDGTGPSVLGCHRGMARERAGAEDGVL